MRVVRISFRIKVQEGGFTKIIIDFRSVKLNRKGILRFTLQNKITAMIHIFCSFAIEFIILRIHGDVFDYSC